MKLKLLLMTGDHQDDDRSAQAESAHLIVTMADSGLKSAHRKGLPRANKLPSTGGLLHDNTSQKLTLHKFRTCLTLLFELSQLFYCIPNFIYPPKTASGDRGSRVATSVTRHNHHIFVMLLVILFHVFFSCSHTRFPKSYRSVFFVILNVVPFSET
jgi:hypothetical protein